MGRGLDLTVDDITFPETRAYVELVLERAEGVPGKVRYGAGILESIRPRDPRVAALALAVGLVLADSSIVVLALPEIYRDLDTSVSGVTWVLVSFNLVMALAAVPAALLARRVGPGRAAAVGLAIFAGAGLACGISDQLSTLLVARCVQALGGAAGGDRVARAAARDGRLGAPRDRVWASAGATGAALGPAVGGFLTQLVSWQSIFLLQVPIALAAAVPILTVARHEMSTRVIERELAPHRPAAPLGERGAGDGLGLDRRGALPPRPAADRRLAPEPDRRRDRRLDDAAGGAARLAPRRLVPIARARAAAGAILLAGGLAGLALLPKARSALTLPPQALIGVGLSLVALGAHRDRPRTAARRRRSTAAGRSPPATPASSSACSR